MKKKQRIPTIIRYNNRDEMNDNVIMQCIDLTNQATLYFHEFYVKEKLYQQSYLTAYNDFFTNSDERLYVIFDGKIKKFPNYWETAKQIPKVMGILKIYVDTNHYSSKRTIVYIQNIFILPEYRGMGYASDLVRRLFNDFPSAQFSISVLNENIKAVNFWKNLGFTTPFMSTYYLNWDDGSDHLNNNE